MKKNFFLILGLSILISGGIALAIIRSIEKQLFFDEVVAITENRVYGKINEKIVVANKEEFEELEYSAVRIASKNLLYTVKNKKYGLIDEEGKIILEPIYEEIGSFREGIARVKLNDKYGYVKENGEFITEIVFEEGSDFRNSAAIVKIDGLSRVIDVNGEILIWNVDGKILEYKDGVSIIENNGIKGIITNERVEKLGYKDVAILKNVVLYLEDEGVGALKKNGETVVPSVYSEIQEIDENTLLLKKKGIGYIYSIDVKTQEKLEYEEVGAIREGLISVKKDGKWGFIDKDKKVVVPIEFESVGKFYDGMAIVQENDEFYFINRDGMKIGKNYIYVKNFVGGIAVVASENGYGIINKDGVEIVESIQDEIHNIDGVIVAQRDGKYYIHGKYENEEFISGKKKDKAYENIKISNGHLIIKKGEKYKVEKIF